MTPPYKYLFQSLFSLLLGMPLGVELLGHVVILCLAFCGAVRLLSSDHSAPVSCSHQQCTTAPISPHPHQCLSHSFPAFLTVLSSPEKTVTTHSSTLAWKIPWTEDPGGLQSMGSQRVEHDWAINTYLHTYAVLRDEVGLLEGSGVHRVSNYSRFSRETEPAG